MTLPDSTLTLIALVAIGLSVLAILFSIVEGPVVAPRSRPARSR